MLDIYIYCIKSINNRHQICNIGNRNRYIECIYMPPLFMEIEIFVFFVFLHTLKIIINIVTLTICFVFVTRIHIIKLLQLIFFTPLSDTLRYG